MTTVFSHFFSKILRNPHFSNSHQLRYKSKKNKKQPYPFIIMKASRNEHRAILNLMKSSYLAEEPTSFCLDLKNNPVIYEQIMKALAEGLSLVAKCKYDGCIVGASINETSSPWEPDMKEKMACCVKCPKLKQYMLFHSHLQRLPDLWKCYSVMKVFEMSYLVIRADHRHKGLALRLLEKSIELGADCGFRVVRCDATSFYTSKVCEKLNMHKIGEVPYCTYLGRDLKPVFQPPAPHDIARVYVDIDPQIPKTVGKRKK